MERGTKFVSSEERIRLVTAYYQSGLSKTEFCKEHCLVRRTFDRWLKRYEKSGSSGLKNAADIKYDSIAPNLTTEAELRTEILKLRIENERLKKNYMVETTEDGKTHYIRLKAKNSKQYTYYPPNIRLKSSAN